MEMHSYQCSVAGQIAFRQLHTTHIIGQTTKVTWHIFRTIDITNMVERYRNI